MEKKVGVRDYMNNFYYKRDTRTVSLFARITNITNANKGSIPFPFSVFIDDFSSYIFMFILLSDGNSFLKIQIDGSQLVNSKY